MFKMKWEKIEKDNYAIGKEKKKWKTSKNESYKSLDLHHI